MRNATRDALGPNSEVRAEPAPPGDEPRPHAPVQVSGLVRLSWDAAEHRRARLSCYLPALDRFIEREVVFSPSDPEAERGRTLGFLVASIFIDAGVVAGPTEPAPEQPAVRSLPPTALAAKPAAAAAAARTSLGASMQIAGPGTATGFGAWLGLERALGSSELWLGGAAQVRFGSVPAAQATSRFLALGLEASWLFWMPSPNSWLGVRGSASGAHLSMSHLSDDDQGQPERQGRFLAAFELVLHTGYHFTPASAVNLDLGAQVLSGKTQIQVHQKLVAVWPYAVPVLRLGVKSTF